MANREFLMLAGTYDARKHDVRGWLLSEKLDGQRCFWDGGVTRGQIKRLVPWANNNRDDRYVEEPMATGLWSRYGNVIHAPDWFLDAIPRGLFLDGEIYLGPGRFQETRSIVSKIKPINEEWEKINFNIFEAPPATAVFKDGRINNPNFTITIDARQCLDYVDDLGGGNGHMCAFSDVDKLLMSVAAPKVIKLDQQRLSFDKEECDRQIVDALIAVKKKGGEGLMLRNPMSFWSPKRLPTLLKVKQLAVDEGRVVGYKWGEEGKLLGLMGALTVEYQGNTFNLSGFTDAERIMCDEDGKASDDGKFCPGDVVSEGYYNPRFRRNANVRFYYTALTNDGIPREARYFRE